MKLFLRLIKESFLFAWQALVNNVLRTVLSLLGISIGIFSIILVLSVVDSLEADMKSSFDMIGSDVLFVQKWPMGPEEGDEEYAWWKYMGRKQPSLDDMEMLHERLPSASAMAFSATNMTTAKYENNFTSSTIIMAVTFEYREVIALNLTSGRYFTKQEADAGRNVAIIGSDVGEQLFGFASPLGKEIRLGGQLVQVIGVFEKEGQSLFGTGFDQAAMVPYKFGVRLLNPQQVDASITVKAKAGVSNKQLKDEVIANFRAIRGVKPRGENDFSVIESTMITGMVDSIIGIFNIAGMVIGIFAILVGGFSIANIMFVSVRERTNIIGIQKSLGAKNYFILGQFLFESIALCIIGGILGLTLVWLVVLLLTSVTDLDFILPLARIILGLAIAVIVGIISGIIPALMAARLNPVDAIRSK
ncbi:MAG: ABC transporter permease [Flavobacteriales bacterium]|nr:ABC transporter permease [Flavobacteriales bacterium]